MQQFYLNSDIIVACVPASSFPEGVLAAHEQLHRLVVFDGVRQFFGISRPLGKGKIEYFAAAECREGDDCFKGFKAFTIKKGNYLLVEIKNFRKDIPAIGAAFREMLNQPGIDPLGACIEYYPNMDDVHCMVRLAD